jgi:protein tyrosine phosphatase (PTP) superfamily phosphohydrolase (DUF442 family)
MLLEIKRGLLYNTSMRIKIAVALSFLILFCGCAYLSYVKDPFAGIPAFARVNDNLYRGGYPKARGYAELKKIGVKTIVNLSGKNKYSQSEQKACVEYGFNFVHIPLSVYTWPEDEKVLKFLETILNPANQPVFVHCGNGRDCTGAMISVYRVILEHKGPKEAYREALSYGFWPYRGEVVLKRYIHQLKDRKVFYDFVEKYKPQNQ